MKQKQRVGKVLAERTTDAMKDVAHRYGMLVDAKIDLRGSTVRFGHTGLDLREKSPSRGRPTSPRWTTRKN